MFAFLLQIFFANSFTATDFFLSKKNELLHSISKKLIISLKEDLILQWETGSLGSGIAFIRDDDDRREVAVS